MRQKTGWLVCGLVVSGLIAPALALSDSVGEEGIYAERLHQPPYNLTGRKIAIGQVEIGRPGKFGFDKAVAWNPAMSLAGIFYQDSPAKSNTYVDNHAAMVAAVMVSQDKKLPGVAPGANLYSGAVGSLRRGGQPEECLSTQHIALQNGGDVRAINFSFGESLQRDPRIDAKLDGNALLTQCIDWSARVHDVLYVIAGNQGKGGIPIPTDQYNGITTAYTAKREGKFIKVDFANISALPQGTGRRLIKREINVGQRRAVSLLAPGNKITLYDLKGQEVEVSGTSFAAPHITGSVALLQEFGDRQIRQKRTNWSLDSRRHEVMRVVLLNSADKIKDLGNGLWLGMKRTTVDKHNRTWLDSDAYQNPKIPLDIQMGTGHLNAFRAYQQFDGGQWNPDQPVSSIGWDYRTVSVGSYKDYILEQPLKANSYVSITLAWDRLVELNDKNQNQQYDLAENFTDRGLNNLDVYLMPANGSDNNISTCASTSDVDSIEHIFCPIPIGGRYKIRVQYRQQVNEKIQPYALAWWTVPNN
ncbi:peptidase S8 and S53 subtilisin kexin sedolisin [Gloeothece citriformis PCC 7424]|uniref:Peptidase S8 and S53 subtilisin kexin sedolisin n=1 Tax=Gloeothece citriformis (strain PCC 7424) TaxID=65393 RepID=B7KKI6_GLOC7|nr:S8 family serine peptidase [Gloeothece citriformis]ACK72319.1 peptidase S8 and S53 subtilisin kexin sedolisin [Gloeothece citriformis PCC 7424]